ncbi:putative membrane protein [Sphaerotilus hippei]|uniref:Putative membrane protein n=2 Tax=Sphaerotilus hippei TaxID=744406 RepID=A0A318H8M3_9BURK|nr:putative membrane protein [Sphaerotilus hippei]
MAALSCRPWRAVGWSGPPWPWLLWCALLPWAWSSDRLVASAVLQPLSGASLLVLMAGWPLAMLCLVPVTLMMIGVAHVDAAEALHRMVWLGVLPGTLAMVLGAGVRRWLPHHLFVYILGRGFFATLLATACSGWLAWWWGDRSPLLDPAEQMIGRWLAAWGDAVLSGMLASIFVAFRPQWLATYSDQLYLPPSR